MKENVGHVDFYVNGGVNQPGCYGEKVRAAFKSVSEFARRLVACSHVRAYDYYLESLTNHECKMVGVRCTSYDWFEQGRCGGNSPSNYATLGIRADEYAMYSRGNASVAFYLNTNGQPNYCGKMR